MDTKEKFDRATIFKVTVKTFFYIVTICVVLFFVIGEIVAPDERDRVGTECKEYEGDWVRVLDSGERVAVEMPGKVEAEHGEVVTLVTTLPDNIYAGENMCFRLVWQDMAVYIDGELRQSYSTRDSRPFGTNSAFRYVFLELDETDAGKEMIYEFSSDSKYAGTIRACYIGDKDGIWLQLIRESGMRTLITLFLFCLSLFCIVVCFILKIIYKIDLPLYYLAWTILLCAVWIISELEFRQVLFKNVSILTSITYWSLMLIPFPLMIYMNDIQKQRYEKMYIVSASYSAIILLGGTILQIFDVMQFVEQLPVIHGGLAISILLVIVTITIDVCKHRMGDYLSVGIGIYGLILTAVMEMYLYYIDAGVSLGTILASGLIFLLIMAIVKTGQDLVRSEKKKQQAIAARESQAKFLANMSHEIRTPINAVIGMNEMILRENQNEEIRQYAQNIQSASNMLLELVNEILDFSKIESGQTELVENTYHVASMIQDEILLLNARVGGKAISTSIDVDPNLPTRLYGDELRIKQVLTNLLSNAVKYTKEGSITLKVFFQWLDSENISLLFSVADTGIGIKKEDMSRLFDSFKRLELNNNRNIEGTGLGLNIAKQLVELMKGHITVRSEYGKGSTFIVSIPQRVVDKEPIGNMENAVKEAREEKMGSEEFFTAPGATVLVVDDNSMNLSLMKSLLKRTQMSVDLAPGGKEALEMTKKKKYDLILMDHMMPEIDGVEALRLIREDSTNENRNTMIIALTANAIAGCREMYLGYGFDDYLSKPIQAAGLDEILAKYLSKEEDLLYIDRTLGLSYCMDSDEFYHEIMEVFCGQAKEYLSQLELHFQNRDWKQYAIVAHGLKGNSLNIGASRFSKLSLQHELAAKEENEEFILAEYEKYRTTLIDLIEKVENI